MFDFFGFLGMNDNYDDRKVGLYDEGELVVSTAYVTDSTSPYETAVMHPNYNDGDWVIVEKYDDKEQAEAGHDKWVSIMTAPELPAVLKDVSDNTTSSFIDCFCGDDWRTCEYDDDFDCQFDEDLLED